MIQFLASTRGRLVAAVVLFLHVALAVSGVMLGGQVARVGKAYFVALLVFVLLWFGIDLGIKRWRRRKQDAFDASLAAREGIDDRRREWETWTAELKRQGIDRYSLPFYLLVGEPQSGKSILLQNSDLHFPFGQSRLSGIGGTRGCDWWFTEEAVVLDLAGRLFTHEGGASDQAEWEAFLELLGSYRPNVPANGVLLVIPCDRLLESGREQAVEKANKMQSALLTLTAKIQARVPVYVVLTKADKIFGFAECVHRLGAEKRHEMFGWSRPAEKAEAPFELDEARRGFADVVERARVLRAEMMGTAKVPEALPEIDRMYAFPDELAGIYTQLEVYLRTIFSESSLVDRLYFRGLYLTSGLQTGAPIAKVCAELLGESCEADRRNLEGLFAKQRAYFIKDLIRKRVFSERGLVRPTRTRVVRARRNAVIGYGVAAAVALLTTVGSIVYLATSLGGDEGTVEAYERAIAASRAVAADPGAGPDRLLEALGRVAVARGGERAGIESVFDPVALETVRGKFEELYRVLFDRRLLPLMKAAADRRVRERAETAPASHAQFLTLQDDVAFLLGKVGFGADERARLAALLGRDGSGPWSAERLSRALEVRAECGADPEPWPRATADTRPELWAAADRVGDLWDLALRPGAPWQVDGELGYFLAWMGLERSFAGLEAGGAAGDLQALCDDLHGSWRRLEDLRALAKTDDQTIRVRRDPALAQLERLRGRRAAYLALRAPGGDPAPTWSRAERLEQSVLGRFSDSGDVWDRVKGTVGVDGGPSVQVPQPGAAAIAARLLTRAVCRPDVLHTEGCELGHPRWTAAGLPESLKQLREELAEAQDVALEKRVLTARCLAVGREYARALSDVSALRAVLSAGREDPVSDWHALSHLARLRLELGRLDAAALAAWIEHVGGLLERSLRNVARGDGPRLAEGRELAPDVLDTLAGLQGLMSADGEHVDGLTRSLARSALERIQSAHQERLLRVWRDLELLHGGANTVRIAEDLTRYRSQRAEAGLQDPAPAEWAAQLDELLAERLGRHLAELEKHWSLAATTWGSVGEAAADVARELRDPNLRRKLDRAREIAAPEWGSVADALGSPELERTSALASELRDYEARMPSDLDRHVRALRDHVESFEGVRPGPELARRLAEAPAPSLPSGALGRYFASIHAAFRAFVLGKVREEYLREFRTAVETRAELARRLDRSRGETGWLPKTGASFAEQVYELLSARGVLDGLQRRYHDERCGAAPGLSIHPGEVAAGDAWALDAFLHELRTRFFLQDQPGAGREQFDFTFLIRPAPSAGSIWRVGTLYFSVKAGARVDPEGVPNDAGGQWTVAWSLAESPDFLELLWTRSPSATVAAQARLRVESYLAPLRLVWLAGERVSGGDGQDAWRVVVELEGDDRPCAFDVLFPGRELPAWR